MNNWQDIADLFDSGDYMACIEKITHASYGDPEQSPPVLHELLFHSYVELDRHNEAHAIALQRLRSEVVDPNVALLFVTESLLNLESSSLRAAAPYIQNDIVKETLIDAAHSLILYTFPMPYALVLCLLKSLQGRESECMRAVRAIKNDEDYSRAYEITRKVISETPNSFPFYWIGLVCSHHIDIQTEYAHLMERAITLYPRCWRLYFYYAIYLHEHKAYDQSIESFKHSIELNPYSGENWMRYGSCLADAGRFAEAYRAYKQALKLYRTIQTPVRYSAILHLVRKKIVPLRSRRWGVLRFLPRLWFTTLYFPIIIKQVLAVYRLNDVIERICKVEIHLQLRR